MSAHPATTLDVDCELTEQDFRMVVDIIRRESGIMVRENKQAMVRGRLVRRARELGLPVRRARELGLPSLRAYCDRLKGPGLESELTGLLNALTTNHTAFFREEHHFSHFAGTALPVLLGEGGLRGRFRVWCAAASTGEEPYSIAATLRAWLRGRQHPDCLILATDIDSDVLATAGRGIYGEAATEKLTDNQRRVLGLSAAGPGHMRVDPALVSILRFRQLNILHEWPFRGPFQAIFCRNMLIYFDQPTKAEVISRMVGMLAPGGYLYLGHSEALPAAVQGLRVCGRTTYVRS